MPVADMTIGEIASHLPSSVQVFERLHIDYSCGGGKTLTRACRDCGIATERVISEIEAAESAGIDDDRIDWTGVPLEELIDHIVRHHHWYTWAQLPRLDQCLGRLLQSYHPNYPEPLLLLSGVFRGLRSQEEQHMIVEQTQVFPAIAALSKPASPLNISVLDRQIAALLHEHDLFGQALNEIRHVVTHYHDQRNSAGLDVGLVDEFERMQEDMHVHIHLESNILFPRARKLIAELRAE